MQNFRYSVLEAAMLALGMAGCGGNEGNNSKTAALSPPLEDIIPAGIELPFIRSWRKGRPLKIDRNGLQYGPFFIGRIDLVSPKCNNHDIVLSRIYGGRAQSFFAPKVI